MNGMDTRIIDYLNGELQGGERKELEAALARDEAIRQRMDELEKVLLGVDNLPLHEVDSDLKQRFYSMLTREEERHAQPLDQPARRRLRAWHWQAAAAILLLVGGIWLGNQWGAQQARLQALEMQMTQTKALMRTLASGTSTSSRIQAVHASYQAPAADPEILAVLIDLMQHDPSVNVRLAAIEALEAFAPGDQVPDAMIRALKAPQESVVQIALINALVNLKASEAIPALENLVDSVAVVEPVRNEAQLGIRKL